jgi:hypothetical protein
LGIWKLDQYSEIKEQVLTWNCSSKKLQRTSSRSYPETPGSLKIFKNLEPAVTLKLKKNLELGFIIFKISRTQNWKLYQGKNKSKNCPTLANSLSSTLL